MNLSAKNANTFTLGKAIIKNKNESNKLIVEFNVGPRNLIKTTGNYNVIDTDYDTYALIYSCRHMFYVFKVEYAWILSRKRTLDDAIVNKLIEKLKSYTNKTDKLITADQTNCEN